MPKNESDNENIAKPCVISFLLSSCFGFHYVLWLENITPIAKNLVIQSCLPKAGIKVSRVFYKGCYINDCYRWHLVSTMQQGQGHFAPSNHQHWIYTKLR